MAKSSPRRSLKSLFSRSAVNLSESVEKDKSEREKKKFRFFKFKTKPKSDPAPAKPTKEGQQLLSTAEPSNAAEGGGAWYDGIASDDKKTSLYATAPRSKGKEFSYSELDLRKPKRFATFSFGFGKKKKNDQQTMSKSTFSLRKTGIEEQEEAPPDVSQMDLDQPDAKTMFTMSQPELETTDQFDIPSLPPVATNQSHFPNQSEPSVTLNTQPEATAPLTNGSDFLDVREEPKKAPIATMPELQLDYPNSSEENGNILVDDDSDTSTPTTLRETSSAVGDPSFPASQPPAALNTWEHEPDSDATINGPSDTDILQQSHTNTEISLPDSTRVTLSHPQPAANDVTDITTQNGKLSTGSVDSKIDNSTVESTPVPDSGPDSDSAPIHEEVSERSLPETATGQPATLAVSGEETTPPVSQDAVYGALYETLFPQSFSSEVLSSLSNPPPPISTEIRRLHTKSDPVMVKTLNEGHTETNVIYSRPSASRVRAYTDVNATLGDRERSYSSESWTSYQMHTASDRQRDPDVYRYLLPSESRDTTSRSEMKSASFSLAQDNVGSVPTAESPTPPVSDYVMSQGRDTQVTDTKRRAILVKELVTDEASCKPVCPSPVCPSPVCPSPVPEEMSPPKRLEIRVETSETFFPPSRQTDGSEGPLSPAYLSVGSDDGSAVEIYYSAEEDSADEEMYTVDEQEATYMGGEAREAWSPQRAEVTERGVSKRDEGGYQVVVVKIQHEGGRGANEEEESNSRIEVEQRAGGQRSEAQVREGERSECLVGSDAESREEEVATAVLPRVAEEGEEGLAATPVQQVNTMVCDFAPPACEPHGEGEGSEGNWSRESETEDHPDGENQPPSLGMQYLAHKEIISSEHVRAASSNTREEDGITPTFREAEEQVPPTAEAGQLSQASKRSTESGSDTPAAALADANAGVEVVSASLTHGGELRSDATEGEHNRALHSEWEETFTQSAEGIRREQEQVAVEPSALNADARRPEPEAAERHPAERQAEARPNLNQETLTSTATSGVSASVNQPPEAESSESADEMNSGYSSLSTKLSLKGSSPPKEDEYKSRFRKVSLVRETGNTEGSQDTVDFSNTSVTDSYGTETSSDYRWRNRFDGLSQYRPYEMENSSSPDSLSHRMSDYHSSTSYSSALPEATAYKYLTSSSSSSPGELITLGNRLSDMTKVDLSHESEPAGELRDEWRRSMPWQEELAAPAGEREGRGEGEPVRIKSRWETQELPESGFYSTLQTSLDPIGFQDEDSDSSLFSGVFKATLVELVSEPAAPASTPPATPEDDSPIQFDMDNLVDTLKSMGPSLRPRNPGLRGPPPVLISSLAPIVEDAASPVTAGLPVSVTSPTKKLEVREPGESLKGLYTLPDDLGLKRNTSRDTRSPLELMKQSQDQQPPGTRGLNLPLRASASNSLVMRKSSDSSTEELKSPLLNGNGLHPPSGSGSRLDHSVIFGGHRSSSIDQTLENGKAHRPLFRTGSLPDTGHSNDRMSVGAKEFGDLGTRTEPAGSRFERFSFLLNSPPSSMTGVEDHNPHMSRPLMAGIGSPPSSGSPTRLLSPTSSIDTQRLYTTTDSPLSMFGQTQGMGMGMGVGTGPPSTPILQRSFSSEGTAGVQHTSLFNSMHGGSQFQSQELEPEKNLVSKYRAFPDAYLTKAKEHGKLNPRPGKMYIFDRPGMCGQRIEVRSDVIDATPWELQETISIRVVRGGWVLYEKPNFKGEKIALDEGDMELTFPFGPPEEQLQNGQKEAGEQNGDTSDEQSETKPARRFIIGSLRRAVRDYSVPEISLFPEENAEGKKVTFRDTSDDARIFGFPIKANSIIINAGLWLVYAHPFFQGLPRVLEVGGYSNPAAWGVEQPYVGSVHPLKVGEPKVENMTEPKMVIYDKPYFSGKSTIVTTNRRDFMNRTNRQQTAFMFNVGSLKVQGGIWVGYEKEGFRGHQYLLEEGEYHDWRVWGGVDAELRSARIIRADLTEPMMVMFEQPEEEDGMQEENTFQVTEAIADVELFEYKTSTRSIHVLGGAWIAYSHVDFSGSQYVLEKGFYNYCADWGSQDNRICSMQPILPAPRESSRTRSEIKLYSEPDFQGECHVFDLNNEALPEKLRTKSCRVSGGSWVLYENKQYSGNLYVLSDGDYPNFTSMGCPPDFTIRSIKVVPMSFSVPSISLFGLECLEGREITMDTEITGMVEEGFNDHILSIRVNSGCWVICEHSNYRGRQFLLEPIEITNWPKFSSIETIGSMFPVKQKRCLLRIKNKVSGHFMSVQGGVEEMKSGRVVVTAEPEPMSDIWFYQDGLIKNKLSQTMSLQVMGNVEPAAKVVLWSETRQPTQTWRAQRRGLISSLTFPGCVLDVKGGKTYDKDHVVIMPEDEERPSQQWEIELL